METSVKLPPSPNTQTQKPHTLIIFSFTLPLPVDIHLLIPFCPPTVWLRATALRNGNFDRGGSQQGAGSVLILE